MHGDRAASLFIWFSPPWQHCRPCNRGVNIQIDRRAWFSSSGVPGVEAASPDRELPLQWKPSHKPLPVAWPLKAHVSSWHFLSVCLWNRGFHPVGPHCGLRLSGMMQNTSVFFMGGRQSLNLKDLFIHQKRTWNKVHKYSKGANPHMYTHIWFEIMCAKPAGSEHTQTCACTNHTHALPSSSIHLRMFTCFMNYPLPEPYPSN